MIASYPMYNLPQMQPSLVRWWQDICQYLNTHNISVSTGLTHIETDLYKHWLNPDLFFSQTCGYPLTTVLRQKVKLIGTPIYDSQYCEQSDYCSLFIVRSKDSGTRIEDFRGKRFAFNGEDSQSGFNAVKTFLTEHGLGVPFFGENLISGQHHNSLAMVISAQADICAVDCVTYALAQRHQPDILKNTRVLAVTRPTPGLPLITSVKTSDETIALLFDAINQSCMNDSSGELRSDLLLKGVTSISLETYMQKINPPSTRINKL